MTMRPEIRSCTPEDANTLAETISRSFKDVAERFGLTPENAPRHPSNCTPDWIRADMERGAAYFALEHNGSVAGCVALERAEPGLCYLERLAVLPAHRRHGFGEALVSRVLLEARLVGARRVGIGIIAAHTELKDWYRSLGFVEGSRSPSCPATWKTPAGWHAGIPENRGPNEPGGAGPVTSRQSMRRG